MITKKCKECKNSFKTHEAWVRKGGGKFCDRKCSAVWRSKHIWGSNHPQYKPLIPLVCPVCSKSFNPHNKRSRFCSPLCRGKTYSGEKHYRYIGKASYHSTHWWLLYYHGKAKKCENYYCKKESKIFEWALLKGKEYERNTENFWQLCKSCHMYYDRKPFIVSKTKLI